jgi:hypothetical protein
MQNNPSNAYTSNAYIGAEESCNADGGPDPPAAGSEGGNPVLGSVLWCWEPGLPRVARGTPRLFTGRPYGMGACLESGRG